MTDNEEQKIEWTYCPACGSAIPSIERIRFCIKCGVDLYYIKEHKTLPSRQEENTYAQPRGYPSPPAYYKQDKVMSKDAILDNKDNSQGRYDGPYGLITDDKLLDTKERRLWSGWASISIPLLGFLAMQGVLFGIIILIVFIVMDINAIINIVLNPFFLVIITLVELVLILFPIWWSGRYLQNPNLKNRLTVLGFSTRGFDRKGIMKEVGIGIGFAFIGLLVVIGSSLLIQIILELFGVRIIPQEDPYVTITIYDLITLILMILMMILVVGPCEEIAFRGFMQRGLSRVLSKNWGFIITALIFAGIHLINIFILSENLGDLFISFLLVFPPYLAISLMIGGLYRWREENLIAVSITHGVYNSLTLIIAFLYMIFY
ncbi:MAG: CPBP family intramembrane metalloprotease [Promethearchaeota archaeon]|nr:MAG: CPBP family intramembrane metalloprotease [Candidatus Lokiarchaeota archaeon]